MNLKDKLQGMAKVTAKKKSEEKIANAGRPDKDKQHMHMYCIIRDGAKISSSDYRIGATDTEVQHMMKNFGIKDSTIRFMRWSMVKSGFIVDSGNRRAVISGKMKANVWISTGKYEDELKTARDNNEVILMDKDGRVV